VFLLVSATQRIKYGLPPEFNGPLGRVHSFGSRLAIYRRLAPKTPFGSLSTNRAGPSLMPCNRRARANIELPRNLSVKHESVERSGRGGLLRHQFRVLVAQNLVVPGVYPDEILKEAAATQARASATN